MTIDFTVILHDRKQRQNRTNNAFCLIIKGIFSTFLFPLFFSVDFKEEFLTKKLFFSFDNFFFVPNRVVPISKDLFKDSTYSRYVS